MLHRTPAALFLALIACAACLAQTPYKGLTPGRSNRAEVEKILGSPAREVSATLIEYGPQGDAQKVFVQYGSAAPVAERIEIELANPAPRPDLIRLLRLPQQATAAKKNSKERLEEYFGEPIFVVLTYAAEDVESGVMRVAHFSKDFYKIAAERPGQAVDPARLKTAAAADPSQLKPPPEASNAGKEGSDGQLGMLWQVCEHTGTPQAPKGLVCWDWKRLPDGLWRGEVNGRPSSALTISLSGNLVNVVRRDLKSSRRAEYSGTLANERIIDGTVIWCCDARGRNTRGSWFARVRWDGVRK